MATSKIRTEIVGVTVELSRDEVYGIVNTAERLGELLDILKKGKYIPGKSFRDSFISDRQAAEELEKFYDVSRSVAMMLTAELTNPLRHMP